MKKDDYGFYGKGLDGYVHYRQGMEEAERSAPQSDSFEDSYDDADDDSAFEPVPLCAGQQREAGDAAEGGRAAACTDVCSGGKAGADPGEACAGRRRQKAEVAGTRVGYWPCGKRAALPVLHHGVGHLSDAGGRLRGRGSGRSVSCVRDGRDYTACTLDHASYVKAEKAPASLFGSRRFAYLCRYQTSLVSFALSRAWNTRLMIIATIAARVMPDSDTSPSDRVTPDRPVTKMTDVRIMLRFLL